MRPIFSSKSVEAVLKVTSGAAVPAVGFSARSLRVYFGAARLVLTVIFLPLLFVPQRSDVLWSVIVMASWPATTDAAVIERLTTPALTCTRVIALTCTVIVRWLEPKTCARAAIQVIDTQASRDRST